MPFYLSIYLSIYHLYIYLSIYHLYIYLYLCIYLFIFYLLLNHSILSLQPDGVNILYFKLRLIDLSEFIVLLEGCRDENAQIHLAPGKEIKQLICKKNQMGVNQWLQGVLVKMKFLLVQNRQQTHD